MSQVLSETWEAGLLEQAVRWGFIGAELPLLLQVKESEVLEAFLAHSQASHLHQRVQRLTATLAYHERQSSTHEDRRSIDPDGRGVLRSSPLFGLIGRAYNRARGTYHDYRRSRCMRALEIANRAAGDLDELREVTLKRVEQLIRQHYDLGRRWASSKAEPGPALAMVG